MWLRRLLSSFPRATAIALGVAFLIGLPSLGAGLRADDHWHDALAGDDPSLAVLRPAWWNMFRFFDGDTARTTWFLERGFIPWWSDPEVSISFFRPLSAVTHAVDHVLGLSPSLRHLHSSLWYVACVGAALFAYRRLFGASLVAGLAGLLFATDYAHGLAVGWLAQRNSLLAALFAMLAVASHHTGVVEGKRAAPFSTAFFALLALLSGESGLGALAFLAAHAVTLDPRPFGRRVLSLVPSAIAFVAWAVAYKAGGYGARHSGMYLDVVRDAPAFALSVVEHVPLLLASELGFLGPDLYPFLPVPARVVFFVLAASMLLVAFVSTRALLREDARARFFLLGATLALVPACAMNMVSARLTFGASFGLFGFLGLALGRWLESEAPTPKLTKGWAVWNLVGHLALGPLLFQVTAKQMVMFERTMVKIFTGPADVPPGKRLVFVNPPEPTFLSHAWLGARAAGMHVAEGFFPLSNGATGVTLRRDGDRTLLLENDRGFGAQGTDVLFRVRPMPKGTRVAIAGGHFTVVETNARGLPTVARLELAVPLDDPRLVWIRWDGEKPLPFEVPKVGEVVVVPAVLTVPK